MDLFEQKPFLSDLSVVPIFESTWFKSTDQKQTSMLIAITRTSSYIQIWFISDFKWTMVKSVLILQNIEMV